VWRINYSKHHKGMAMKQGRTTPMKGGAEYDALTIISALARRARMKLRTWGRMRKLWRLWAKSLGEKVGETDAQADTIALIRTTWWITHMLTCMAIILNAIANHGWGLFG
jgi:hypothetical protein